MTASKAAPKEAHAEAKWLKNEGDKAHMERRWAEAATTYRRAIELWPPYATKLRKALERVTAECGAGTGERPADAHSAATLGAATTAGHGAATGVHGAAEHGAGKPAHRPMVCYVLPPPDPYVGGV